MKSKTSVLCRQYQAALGEHLKSGSNSALKKATRLGNAVVALGLETLDLAKMHEQALIAMGASTPAGSLAMRAQAFFVEANYPIERTHLAAANADLRWNKLNEKLHERTSELATSKREVKTHIGQRKAAEESLRTRNAHYVKLLKESQFMQESLRRLTRRVLSAQESERGKISHELHQESAQILLAINVQLWTLRQKGSVDAKKLLIDIARTQQMVEDSIQAIREAARKYQAPREE